MYTLEIFVVVAQMGGMGEWRKMTSNGSPHI